MRYHQYRCKFQLNVHHANYVKNKLGEKHSHEWEIVLDIIKVSDGFSQFEHVQKAIEGFLEQYQNQYMNEMEPFTNLNPTLENICGFLKENLQELLAKRGWLLLKIEIIETPFRSYVMDLAESDEIAGKEWEKAVHPSPEEESLKKTEEEEAEKTEKPEKTEEAAKPEKPEKTAKTAKTAKTEKPAPKERTIEELANVWIDRVLEG